MTELPWPFLGSEALAAKAIPERAMRSLYEPVYPGVYVPEGVDLTAGQRAEAAWLWSRRRGIVAGQSAAALLGTKWVDPLASAELVYDNRHPPAGITVHNDALLPNEIAEVGAMSVTSAARTAFDIGRRTTSRLQAVQRLDALMNVTDVKANDVEAVIAEHPGVRGLVRLRQVLPLADGGAESPQETRTRLVLIDAGLPRPQTQIAVYDEYGDFVARIDMGYEEYRVGIEYDGLQHWLNPEQRARDIDRQTALLDLGWVIVRVSSELLRYRQGTVIARVVAAMRAAGWRP
ncbi:endonuclease domain-containing protein [uncultured Mycobacterium sp.]|uniref:endonuclease domain-containing protein n=1 Tax=uncultured Mycobacterium sp. TaxID=171292 RepID=UPI0035C9E9AC